jgi:hypothetical protein
MSIPPEQIINNWRIERKNKITSLIEYKNHKDQCWMSNNKKDVKDQKKMIPNDVYGNILVLGLGLGIIIEMLAKYEKVKYIAVIEQAPEVIEMVWKYIEHNNKAEIIQMKDINYIKSNSNKYNYVFADTHIDCSDKTKKRIVEPLKQLTKEYYPSAQFIPWKTKTKK